METQIQRIFNQFDDDGNGYLDDDEVKELIHQLVFEQGDDLMTKTGITGDLVSILHMCS